MSRNKKQYYKVEHIWRLGRWILGFIVILLWEAPATVFLAYGLLGAYEQLHGVICHRIEKLLKYREQHDDWE